LFGGKFNEDYIEPVMDHLRWIFIGTWLASGRLFLVPDDRWSSHWPAMFQAVVNFF
jgi:hypothetical protein